MRALFAVVFLYQTILLNGQATCPSSGVICVSQTQYQFCTTVNGVVQTTGGVTTCPAGYECSSTSSFTCQASSGTTASSSSSTSSTSSSVSSTSSTSSSVSSTSSTSSSVTTPLCTADVVYPGPQCNQYYDCVYVMWWWDYVVVTCAAGQAFNEATGQCEDSTTCVV